MTLKKRRIRRIKRKKKYASIARYLSILKINVIFCIQILN